MGQLKSVSHHSVNIEMPMAEKTRIFSRKAPRGLIYLFSLTSRGTKKDVGVIVFVG